ncbi:MAG: hypothetical protein ACYS0G_03030 [Planctomycetota bacterium]|jgi:hypothetical protein
MAKRKKKRTSKPAAAKNKKVVRARHPRGGLHTVSTTELQAEIRRRERLSDSLLVKRQRLLKQLEDLDAQVESLGRQTRSAASRVGSRRAGTRPRNPVVLVDALKRVLDKKTLSVSDAATAVRRAGDQTTSANFRTIVNQTLIGNRRTFKKVARGMYTLKKS